MNRRQFLGRLFQAVISAHNSKSIYGIYHPWRQYNDIKTTVYIYFRYRTGINPSYDPSNPNSSQYNYSAIPYTGAYGPIMALYDSNDTMIYCSAYDQANGTLYNGISNSIYFSLPAGTYTLKCLSLGKGLYLGESGQSLTFTVEPVSREIDPSTGEYNKYNNYGWINTPSLNIDFLFDYEGLSFDFETEYIKRGTDISKLDGVYTATYTYPSYEEYYNTIKTVYGNEPTYEQYMDALGYLNTAAGPYEFYEYYTDIMERKCYVSIYEHKGFNNKTSRGKVDVTSFTNTYDPNYMIDAVAYKKVYDEKGLELNIDLLMDKKQCVHTGGSTFYEGDTKDGSKAINYFCDHTHFYYNVNAQFGVSRYPGSGGGSLELNHKAIVKNMYLTNVGRNVYTDTNTSTYVYIPTLQLSVSEECDRSTQKYGTENFLYMGSQITGRAAGANSTPGDEIMYRVNKALTECVPKSKALLAETLTNGFKTAKEAHTEGLNRWMQRYTSDRLYSYGWSSQYSYRYIPLDVIFGNMTGNLKYVYNNISMPKDSSGMAIYENSVGGLNAALNKFGQYDSDREVIKFVEVPLESNLDITGYEFCSDYRTGWFNNLVLRQEIVHLDLSDVPDHPIRPN